MWLIVAQAVASTGVAVWLRGLCGWSVAPLWRRAPPCGCVAVWLGVWLYGRHVTWRRVAEGGYVAWTHVTHVTPFPNRKCGPLTALGNAITFPNQVSLLHSEFNY